MTRFAAPPTRPSPTKGRDRLTDVDRQLRAVSEKEFQAQVTDLAVMLGWAWVHFRPAQTAHGWRTPVSGPLGKGWPDVTLLRVRDRRLIFAELKRETEQVTADQAAVLAALGALERPPLMGHAKTAGDAAAMAMLVDGVSGGRVETFLWRPSDLRDPIERSRIYEVLR